MHLHVHTHFHLHTYSHTYSTVQQILPCIQSLMNLLQNYIKLANLEARVCLCVYLYVREFLFVCLRLFLPRRIYSPTNKGIELGYSRLMPCEFSGLRSSVGYGSGCAGLRSGLLRAYVLTNTQSFGAEQPSPCLHPAWLQR